MHARPSALLAVLALALPLLAAAQGAGAEQGQQVQARVQLQPASGGGPSETAPLTLQLTPGACSSCAALEVSSGLGSTAVGLALARVAKQLPCRRCFNARPASPRPSCLPQQPVQLAASDASSPPLTVVLDNPSAASGRVIQVWRMLARLDQRPVQGGHRLCFCVSIIRRSLLPSAGSGCKLPTSARTLRLHTHTAASLHIGRLLRRCRCVQLLRL